MSGAVRRGTCRRREVDNGVESLTYVWEGKNLYMYLTLQKAPDSLQTANLVARSLLVDRYFDVEMLAANQLVVHGVDLMTMRLASTCSRIWMLSWTHWSMPASCRSVASGSCPQKLSAWSCPHRPRSSRN